MKIAIYNTKWGVGKTPIATNISLEKGFAIGTNEPYHVYHSFIPDNQLLSIGLNDSFPDLPSNIDIVFDLAGTISETSHSITTAIKQADVVLIPICNELKAITAGLHTIWEVLPLNANIFVIATKLQRKKWDRFKSWDKVGDFVNIEQTVQKHYPSIKVLPLKQSNVFDTIFEQEKSVHDLITESWLNKYHYHEVHEQFADIYNAINL